jgi:endonuclease/exonuclease/phosphatase family metal-dependent hydrolase
MDPIMKVQCMAYNVHGLPWSKNQSANIVQYILDVQPDVLCLQEVFTDVLRKYFSETLTAHGYTVVSPRDDGVAIMGSGLLSAFKTARFRLLSTCFYPYTVYHNVEIGANKGFQTIRLVDAEGRRILLANTHMQSDTKFRAFGLTSDVPTTRKAQFTELVRWLERDRDPVLLLGDMNCEQSPHAHVRFLKDPVLQKSTLPSTGEDLDHVAWLPMQWAPPGTSWCSIDATGVRAISYRVDPVPWSDHFPIVVDILVPEFRPLLQEECGGSYLSLLPP